MRVRPCALGRLGLAGSASAGSAAPVRRCRLCRCGLGWQGARLGGGSATRRRDHRLVDGRRLGRRCDGINWLVDWSAARPPSGSRREPAAAAVVDPDPGFAVEPAPGSLAGPSWKPSFCPAPPSGCAVRISRPVCPRLYSTFFFPCSNVKPNGKTLPCLRWNRGSCLSVARHSRGDILKRRTSAIAFARLRALPLFLLAGFP